ncbi:DNA-directed RNA polymerase subunit K [Frankliniella fusca]|uniref:DNA-directed RNA polymerase subunit K n=1 Tax=Frankliniella fusca TaxID=407009 RepID=A0AAE1LF18_9NEOP|nr:DNA-directed RNA polymerase subunit K [Frankliniella fusca]
MPIRRTVRSKRASGNRYYVFKTAHKMGSRSLGADMGTPAWLRVDSPPYRRVLRACLSPIYRGFRLPSVS